MSRAPFLIARDKNQSHSWGVARRGGQPELWEGVHSISTFPMRSDGHYEDRSALSGARPVTTHSNNYPVSNTKDSIVPNEKKKEKYI